MIPRVQSESSQLLSDCKWTSGHGRGTREEPSGASHNLEGQVKGGGMGGGCAKGQAQHNALPKVQSQRMVAIKNIASRLSYLEIL